MPSLQSLRQLQIVVLSAGKCFFHCHCRDIIHRLHFSQWERENRFVCVCLLLLAPARCFDDATVPSSFMQVSQKVTLTFFVSFFYQPFFPPMHCGVMRYHSSCDSVYKVFLTFSMRNTKVTQRQHGNQTLITKKNFV